MTTPKDKHNPTRNGHCSGCTDPQSEGTHQMGTFEHPDEAPKDKSQAEILAEKEIPWDQATTDALGLSCDGVYNTRDIARAAFIKGYAAAQEARMTDEPVAWMSDSGEVVSASGKLRMEEAEHPVGIHYDIALYRLPNGQASEGEDAATSKVKP